MNTVAWDLTAIGPETYAFFFLIAILYSSVGFGGGSSYQAWLVLLEIPLLPLRSLALLCNLAVVSSGCHLFSRCGHLKLRKIYPLIVSSVPAAFLGGSIQLTEQLYFLVLASFLTLAAILLFFLPDAAASKTSAHTAPKADHLEFGLGAGLGRGAGFGLGAGLGFLAGLVGIGGGIFLAPILHFLRWDQAKVISATASFFILVNSVAGLGGQILHTPLLLQSLTYAYQEIGLCIAAVILGGQIGTRCNLHLFHAKIIKRITALFMLVVAVRLFIKVLA